MIRLDFVSNSSSSSHIVIADKVTDDDIKMYKEDIKGYTKIFLPSEDEGTPNFGWEWIDYRDFWSKMNFCAIQLYDLKHYCTGDRRKMPEYYREFYKRYTVKTCFDMFKKVCKEKFGLEVSIKDEYSEDEKYDFYIDHQSSVTEGRNMEMFDSEDKLYRFLASNDSYVQGGNDNEYPESY